MGSQRIEPSLGDIEHVELPAGEPRPPLRRVERPRVAAPPAAPAVDEREPTWFGFAGRLSAPRYLVGWLFFCFVFPLIAIGLVALGLAVIALGGPLWTWPLIALGSAGAAAVGVFLASLLVRRLHDLDLSGWWGLLALAPGLNALAILALGLAPGARADNRFGPPNPRSPWHVWLALAALIAVPLVGAPVFLSTLAKTDPAEIRLLLPRA